MRKAVKIGPFDRGDIIRHKNADEIEGVVITHAYLNERDLYVQDVYWLDQRYRSTHTIEFLEMYYQLEG